MNRFYITGGTMHADASSYVERQADRELFEGLLQGDFCYILTSRQMGKSSLMVHTAENLRRHGRQVVVIDLTTLGQNLSPEQWYDGMMQRVGQQLHLEDELDAFWSAHARLGPAQRFFTALRDVVMARTREELVVFLDEIDTVRSLSFSTDEFFSAIRACYNNRSEEPEYRRLTFCLLGVTTPSDLIRDTRTTPFNIGRRIELNDFSPREAQPLARGLNQGPWDEAALLRRVMWWTGGHPYLTQRLCEHLADHGRDVLKELRFTWRQRCRPLAWRLVDHACRELFLTSSARQEDDNLIFVRERLLRGEARREDILSCYRHVRRGHRKVPDDRTNQVITLLRLSGIVRIKDGHLRLRNRIYTRAFDQGWIDTHMPDAELRRQREAYLRGFVRATVLILLVGAGVVFMVYRSKVTATRRLADSYAATGNRLAGDGDLISALPWYTRALEMNQGAGELARRYRILIALTLRQCPQLVHMWFLKGEAHSARFSPDGTLVAVAGTDGEVKVFHAATGRALPGFMGLVTDVMNASFSRDGRFLAAADADGRIRIWRTEDGSLAMAFRHTSKVFSVQFDLTGEKLLTACADDRAILWDWKEGSMEMQYADHHADVVRHAVFSPDNTKIVTASQDRTARIWDRWNGTPIGKPLQHANWVYQASFSPDGSRIVTAEFDNMARLWDAETGEPSLTIEHDGPVRSAVFSPDGTFIATACWDLTTRFWEVRTGKRVGAPIRHSSSAYDVSFNPDGYLLTTTTAHGAVSVWNLIPAGWTPPAIQETYSGDGTRYVTLHQGKVQWWHAETRTPAADPFPVSNQVHRAYLNLRGDRLVTVHRSVPEPGVTNHAAQLWDPARGAALGPLFPYARTLHRFILDPAGTQFVATTGREAEIWDAATGRARQKLVRAHDITLPTFDSSGDRLLFATGNTAEVVDLSNRRPPLLLSHPAGVSDVEFSKDGASIVTACKDGSFAEYAAQRWDARTGAPLGLPMRHRDGVLSATFSPDDSRVVSCGEDNIAQIWSAKTSRRLAAPLSHKNEVICASYSPDSQWIATGSRDKTARVWDAQFGAPITPPLRHDYSVFKAVFVANGRGLLTEERRHVYRYWDLSPDLRPVPVLKRVSQLLARYEVDRFGVAVPLDRQELRHVWNQFTADHSRIELPSPTAIRDWHERRMLECQREGNKPGERLHLDQLLQHKPDNQKWLERRRAIEEDGDNSQEADELTASSSD